MAEAETRRIPRVVDLRHEPELGKDPRDLLQPLPALEPGHPGKRAIAAAGDALLDEVLQQVLVAGLLQVRGELPQDLSLAPGEQRLGFRSEAVEDLGAARAALQGAGPLHQCVPRQRLEVTPDGLDVERQLRRELGNGGAPPALEQVEDRARRFAKAGRLHEIPPDSPSMCIGLVEVG